MQEEWKPLYYHGECFGNTHEISNYGRIRNCKTKHIMKLHINKNGYYQCVISRGRKRKIAVKIHRAVAENFLNGDRNLTIDHKDCNKLNNRADNLEFVTNEENISRALQNNLIRSKKFTADDKSNIIELRNNGVSVKEIAKQYGVCRNTIWMLMSGRTYKHLIA